VRWVSRDYRDRFHADSGAERQALRKKAEELLEGPPASVLLENC